MDWATGSKYGSFQLHRLSATASENRTVFAWNRHDSGPAEIGFGQSGSTHTDWTFASMSDTRSNFNLKVFIDVPVAPSTTFTISYAAGTGGSGSAPGSPTSVMSSSTFTTPANTYTRAGYTFAGWSDGSATYAAGTTYPASGGVSGNVTLTATWTVTPTTTTTTTTTTTSTTTTTTVPVTPPVTTTTRSPPPSSRSSPGKAAAIRVDHRQRLGRLAR